MRNVEEMIRTYVAENMLFSANGYPYADSASFLEEGIIGSMGILELIMFVEENFHITVGDEEVVPDNFDSVSKLAAYIRTKSSAAAGAV